MPRSRQEREERDDSRSEARERALTLLYEAESKGLTGRDTVEALPVKPDDLAVLLVEGVDDHRDRLDQLIISHAKGWTLERMPTLDRCVLRIAVYELLERTDVPTAVVIDEAVELAKNYSTDDSGRFVNGMLSAIAAKVRAA
jgi:transcription antitermination protein NusB